MISRFPSCKGLASRAATFFRSLSLPMLGLGLALLASRQLMGQLEFEAAPINYHDAPTNDDVARLQRQLDAGETQLEYDPRHGYLNAVLEQLGISTSSQMLVFSKTSFQQRLISPQRPRALYFNDDVYVGWVQGGDVVEISVAAPQQGAVFYTLSQKQSDHPKFIRDRGQCLTCHASSRTAGVPGHLVRSVYPDRSGQPFYGSGTFTTDHRSPFEERWGGWYVTGTHGSQRHMGNVLAKNQDRPEELDVDDGANVTTLDSRLNLTPYLTAHSDIVALMVLEHQTQMHNFITRASFETRIALHYDEIMNKAMGRPLDYRSDSARRRIESASDKLVDYLLFVDEFPLRDAVAGTSGFASEFADRGPRDRQGRSLRELDLQHRLMKYPCSYLIYSEAFDQLPQPVKDRTYHRLFDILTGVVDDVKFQRLTSNDRRDILEILRDTKSDLPEYWQAHG